MTKPCPFPPLGCDPLLYTLSPLWPLALVSIPRLQSPQSVFDPLSLFLPHTSLTIQNEVQDERCGDERAEERARSPSKGKTQQKKPDCSHRCRYEQETQLLPSKKPLFCKQFLKMQGGDATELCWLMLFCSNPRLHTAASRQRNGKGQICRRNKAPQHPRSHKARS